MATSNQIALKGIEQKERDSQRQDERGREANTINKRRNALESEKLAHQKRQDRHSRIMDYADLGSKMINSSTGAVKGIGTLIGALNDPRWYASPEIAKSIADIPWGDMYGTEVYPLDAAGNESTSRDTVKVHLSTGEGESSLQFANKQQAPAVVAMISGMSIGKAGSKNDEVNRSAQRLFDLINMNNGRVGDYEDADLMMYCCAVSSVHAYLAHLKRIYGALHMYSPTNEYYPRTIVKALGADFDSLIENIYDFKGHINWLVEMLESIPMIPEFNIGLRWIYENSYVFQQEDIHKSQSYLYVPAYFYKLELDTSSGTCLSTVDWCARDVDTLNTTTNVYKPGLKSFNDILEFTNILVDAFTGMQDARIMRADILKAYGDKAMIHPELITSDYSLKFAYDEVSLLQFKNAVIYGSPRAIEQESPDVLSTSNSSAVWQENGVIYSEPKLGEGERYGVYVQNHILTSTIKEGSADLVLELTRTIPPMTKESQPGLSGFCASIPCSMAIYAPSWNVVVPSSDEADSFDEPILLATTIIAFGTPTTSIARTAALLQGTLTIVGMTRKFDYMPALYIGISVGLSSDGVTVDYANITDRIGDWDYFATISSDRLKTMSKSIALHMLGANNRA